MNAETLAHLRGGLIVSCQAKEGEPMRDAAIMAVVAQTVVQAGAVAVRVNLPDHIRAVRALVDVPIFGIYKQVYSDSDVYITPTLREAEAVVASGADVLTVDATRRARPNGQTLQAFVRELKAMTDRPIMADISTLDEGLEAAALGVDFISTTLSGYTPYSLQTDAPDLALVAALVAALAKAVSVPVIAEGRIHTPAEARQALDSGAFAVVVGSMITRPGHITSYFLRGLRDSPS